MDLNGMLRLRLGTPHFVNEIPPPIRIVAPPPRRVEIQPPLPPHVQQRARQGAQPRPAGHPVRQVAVQTVPASPATGLASRPPTATAVPIGLPALDTLSPPPSPFPHRIAGYLLNERTMTLPNDGEVRTISTTQVKLTIHLHRRRGEWVPEKTLARLAQIRAGSVDGALRYLPTAFEITRKRDSNGVVFWRCGAPATDPAVASAVPTTPKPNPVPLSSVGPSIVIPAVQHAGAKRGAEGDLNGPAKKRRIAIDTGHGSAITSQRPGTQKGPGAAPPVTVPALLGISPGDGNGGPHPTGASQLPRHVLTTTQHLQPRWGGDASSSGYTSAQLLSSGFSSMPLSGWMQQPASSTNTNTNTNISTEYTSSGTPSADPQDREVQDEIDDFWTDRFQGYDNW